MECEILSVSHNTALDLNNVMSQLIVTTLSEVTIPHVSIQRCRKKEAIISK